MHFDRPSPASPVRVLDDSPEPNEAPQLGEKHMELPIDFTFEDENYKPEEEQRNL